MNLFQRTFAYMRNVGKAQSPVIEGSAARRNQVLLGTSIPTSAQRSAVAVQSVKGNTVVIHQGIAAGLTEGTELVMAGNDGVRVRISRVTGLASSSAEIISGTAATIKPGALFAVEKWAAPAVPDLRVFASTTDLTGAQLTKLHARIKHSVRARGYGWITDPTQTTPTHIITYADHSWLLIPPVGERQSLGDPLTDKNLIDTSPIRNAALSRGPPTPSHMSLPRKFIASALPSAAARSKRCRATR